MTGAMPRRSPGMRLVSSAARGTRAVAPGARRVVRNTTVRAASTPRVLVPPSWSADDDFTSFAIGQEPPDSDSLQWSTNDGDSSYLYFTTQTRANLAIAVFTMPAGVPSSWFDSPVVRIAAKSTVGGFSDTGDPDDTHMILEVRLQSIGDGGATSSDAGFYSGPDYAEQDIALPGADADTLRSLYSGDALGLIVTVTGGPDDGDYDAVSKAVWLSYFVLPI